MPETLLSIILPTLNESRCIVAALDALAPLRHRGVEVIVVDGGSEDDTATLAAASGATVISSSPGRARQQNAGARAARGEVLLFLHVDTQLPATALDDIDQALANPAAAWGRFDVSLRAEPAPGSVLLRVVATMMNMRSRLTGIATGDQAIFVRASVFQRVGGFPEIALMEDIALSKLLRRLAKPMSLRSRVQTSARRWQTQGIGKTIGLMWSLRLGYWCGVAPDRLARWYRHVR